MNAEPRSVRRIGLGIVLAGAALITSACAAGKQAQTADEHPTVDGANADLGDIALRGIAIQTPPNGNYEAGQDALLRGVIANTGGAADQLTDVSSPIASGWGAFASAAAANAVVAADQSGAGATGAKAGGSTLPVAKNSVTIAPGERAAFGVPDSTGAVVLTDLHGKLYAAATIPVTFTFAHAGQITFQVPVEISGKNNSVQIPEPAGSSEG